MIQESSGKGSEAGAIPVQCQEWGGGQSGTEPQVVWYGDIHYIIVLLYWGRGTLGSPFALQKCTYIFYCITLFSCLGFFYVCVCFVVV